MPATLAPPERLDHFRYFVVRYLRHTGRFELIEPDRAATYDIGDVFAARKYLERAAGEYLGGRALDSAYSFGASQAIPKERRAFGLDLLRIDLDAGRTHKRAAISDAERMLGPEWLDE